MPFMTGADALVAAFKAHGIKTLFGLPGVQLDPFFNALHDAGESFRFIHTRHEQGAGYLAWGYAEATGGIGCYCVVPGPGFLNTTAALSTAYATNSKVLCLSGQIPSAYIGRGAGLLHEIPDQQAVMRSLTKWSQRIETPEAAPGAVAEAVRQLNTGRPQPVGLEMAPDVMFEKAEIEPLPVESPPAFPPLDEDKLESAARLLANAESPMIFVGGGALHASEEVQALAEALQAPVIESMSGRGVLTSRHPLSHTMPAGHRLWPKADVVLAVGTRLLFPRIHWGTDGDLKVIRIDIDPEEHDRIESPAIGILGDSQAALTALIPKLERQNKKRGDRTSEMIALKGEMAQEFSRLEPQLTYLNVIREELPDDGIFVDGLTQIGYIARYALPVYQPRTYISSGYQGTLGASFPCGLGVKVAKPDKPVLAVAGDGGFLFNVQELATAVQHNIGLVTVVFNDGAYGNVKRMQEDLYDNRVIGTELHNPDFVTLAESFGACGLRADSADSLRKAIRHGFQQKGPTVIEVPVGKMPEPWSFVVMPRVRGQETGEKPPV